MAAQPIEAPASCSPARDVQKYKAVQHRPFPAILNGPEAAGSMLQEVGGGHVDELQLWAEPEDRVPLEDRGLALLLEDCLTEEPIRAQSTRRREEAAMDFDPEPTRGVDEGHTVVMGGVKALGL